MRLSRVLVEAPAPSFGTFARLASNAEALDLAHQFSDGACSFLAIVGPSGWGKSHILTSAAARVSRLDGREPNVCNASEWALGMARGDAAATLLLDNVQDVMEKPRVKTLLKAGLERRMRSGRRTMLSFTAARSSRQIRNLLPLARQWNWAALQAPTMDERVLVLEQMAAGERLELSDALTDLIARRMRGNGRTISGALKRLKLFGSRWTSPRHIIRACGVLDMFFIDNSAWDLRGVLAESARRLDSSDDLAAYLMLREAALSESHVAQFLRVTPSSAYQAAARFARLAEESPESKALVDAAIQSAVLRLCQD
jgi:chromosomal replication initiation ATPase DnaA